MDEDFLASLNVSFDLSEFLANESAADPTNDATDQINYEKDLLTYYIMGVLKVGVTVTRYVSLRNCRPWVIHAFRNIKGRGLHVDEEAAAGNQEVMEKGPVEGISSLPDTSLQSDDTGQIAPPSANAAMTGTVPHSDAGAVSHGGQSKAMETVQIVDLGKLSTVEDPEKNLATRRMRKRKLPTDHGVSDTSGPNIVSTYDKVRLLCHPWKKPEGTVNKPILRMMLESVMMYLMTHPGACEEHIWSHYSTYLQPMAVRNLLTILEDIGCVTREYIRPKKASLFSKPSAASLIPDDDYETDQVLYVPTIDCLIRLGQFGQEAFQTVAWPVYELFKPKKTVQET